MGVAASVKGNIIVGVDQVITDDSTPEMPPASDHALREALRNLQLSPDLIDTSASAIYAHVRDPIEHPVDKELARLCTSEYTRGALHALCLYLVAASESEVNGRTNKPYEAESADTAVYFAAKGSRNGTTALSPEAKTNCRIGVGTSTPTESVSGKLSTFWNRMRRTRSMPAKGQGLILPLEDDEDADEKGEGGGGYRFPEKDRNAPSPAAAQPKLSVRIGAAPRISSGLLAGLGLGSPSGRAAGEVATPRRAPVRTGHWKLGHEIGKGSFGAVHIGLNEDTGDLIAVKQLSLRNADQAEELYTEIELMRQLTHPNIVSYLGAEVNDNEKTISIFQEWVPGSVTTLLVNFGPFSDRRIAGYTRQILQGLVYLHSERVIHRDIKGGNILIDDRGVVKLCDFGASKLLDAESFTGLGDHTRVGSPLFMAPEILLREDYGPQVDIWSLGGAVLEMATGQPPWHTLNLRTPVALINWVKRTEGPPPLPEGLSPPLTKFLVRCFERDPNKRATARDLLSDPFVAKRRAERALFPKGPTQQQQASDADSVVSDIDNLSRTAAIARIRRASVSDYSRPNSDQSAPSPRGSDFAAGGGGSSASGVGGGNAGRGGAGAERNPSPPREAGSRGGGGGGRGRGGSLTDLAQEVVARLEDAGDGGGAPPSPRRPVSLHSALAPPLRVVTAGLEPAALPSSAPRVATTPPGRRVSMGRNSPGTPNPFGGRRRSLDTSPDGARSSMSPRASPRASGVSPGGLSYSGGSQGQIVSNAVAGVDGNGGGGEEGSTVVPAAGSLVQNAGGVGSVAVAGAGGAEEAAAIHASSRGDLSVSPSAAKLIGSGGSSSRSRCPSGASGGSREGEKTVDGDHQPAPVAAPASGNVPPARAVAGAEKMAAHAQPAQAPSEARLGRGGRPSSSGRLSAGTAAAGCSALE